jgi:hypothetical protein
MAISSMAAQPNPIGPAVGAFHISIIPTTRAASTGFHWPIIIQRSQNQYHFLALVGGQPGRQIMAANLPLAIGIAAYNAIHHVQFHFVCG